jgi:hypothetical protein
MPHPILRSSAGSARQIAWGASLFVGFALVVHRWKAAAITVFVSRNEDPGSLTVAMLGPLVLPFLLVLGAFAPRVGGALVVGAALASMKAFFDWLGLDSQAPAYGWIYFYPPMVVVGLCLAWSGSFAGGPRETGVHDVTA